MMPDALYIRVGLKYTVYFIMNDMVLKPFDGTPAIKVGDAVGVSENEKKEWFVAIVNNHSERKNSQWLESKGYKVFVPVQTEERVWRTGVKKKIDKVLIPAVIFICCSEKERLDIVNMPFVKRFMVDYTKRKADGRSSIARIPDCQIENFRKYIENADEPIEVECLPYNLGDKVRVVRGKFKGVEGYVFQNTDGKANLVICIGLLGCAKLNIDIRYIKRI